MDPLQKLFFFFPRKLMFYTICPGDLVYVGLHHFHKSADSDETARQR